MLDDLTNKVALVTGASRGIGRAIAVALARAGCHVAVNYVAREAAARQVCTQIEALGRRACLVQADVSSGNDVQRLVKTLAGTLGSPQILVNNAGITRPEPIEKITEQSWNEVLDINLKSVFLLTQALLPAMRAARWGRIINLSSVAAQLGGVVGPHYAASKAGILGLTHSYAHLLARENISVNAIAPALIETEMVTGNPLARPQLIPLGRFGTVEETAEVAVLLARNGYITGQTINVNGGWYMS